jgi:Domain of Kin17 curved DNA-binding protein
LSDFAHSLLEQGLVEITKEPDLSGTEQILIRLIDRDREKKAALEALQSKESTRERERKREEKDIERMIK